MSLQAQAKALFLLDQQVRGLRTRLDAALKHQATQEARLTQFRQQQQELADQSKVARSKAMTLETDAKQADDRVVKLRDQMNNVKTNKEYQALLVEVNTLKADKSKVEDLALAELTKADEVEKRLTEAKEKVAQQEKILAGAAAEVARARGEVGQQLESVTAQRDAAAAALPAEALSVFDRASHHNDGESMAPIVEESRRHREYTCGGCYVNVPLERVNALLSRDELVSCPNCSRILYVEDELKSALSK